MGNMTDNDFIEMSKPNIPDGTELFKKNPTQRLFEAQAQLKKIQAQYGKYEEMEVKLGVSDYWNIIVEKMDIIVKIVKFTPKALDLISKVIDVISIFKLNGGRMTQNGVDTVKGIIRFVFPILGIVFKVTFPEATIEAVVAGVGSIWGISELVVGIISGNPKYIKKV